MDGGGGDGEEVGDVGGERGAVGRRKEGEVVVEVGKEDEGEGKDEEGKWGNDRGGAGGMGGPG